MRMLPLGKLLTTPLAAMARHVSSLRGASASLTTATFSMAQKRRFLPGNASTRKVARGHRTPGSAAGTGSVVAPRVVDDLAVVGELARRMKPDFAAQLGDVADRSNDGLGMRRCAARDFHVQRHAIDLFWIVDHEPRANDLRMALDDLRNLRRMHEHPLDLGRLVGPPQPALESRVRTAAGGHARNHCGQIARPEADQGIVDVAEHADDDFADLAGRDGVTGSRANDLDQHPLVDDKALARS